MTDLPRGPWKKVSVDFAGPLGNNDMALVFWDQYARYPVVEFTSFPYLRACSTRTEFPKRSNRIIVMRRLSKSKIRFWMASFRVSPCLMRIKEDSKFSSNSRVT